MTEKTEENVKSFPWRGIGIFFTTFAVIVLLIMFYVTNMYYAKFVSQSTHGNNQVARLSDSVDELEKTVQQLAESLKAQDDIINTVRQTQSGYSREEWRIVEAEFLVKLANDKLQFEKNTAQGIALLQQADQHVRDMNEARLLPIRKALASDIANLQAVPVVDMAGIYMRLSAIHEQLSQLPLPNKPAQQAIPDMKTDGSMPWWKHGLQQTWQTIRQIVVVRYHEAGAPPLIMPEQQDFLYQNLHASVEKAMWGLLHHNTDLYRASLEQLAQWIKQYFVVDAPVTQSVLKNVAELQQINIAPTVPAISDSLQAFHNYFAEKVGGQASNQPTDVH